MMALPSSDGSSEAPLFVGRIGEVPMRSLLLVLVLAVVEATPARPPLLDPLSRKKCNPPKENKHCNCFCGGITREKKWLGPKLEFECRAACAMVEGFPYNEYECYY
jgi:hypothetical protein